MTDTAIAGKSSPLLRARCCRPRPAERKWHLKPKDEAREWLDQRCGRNVRVETRVANSTLAPLTNEGALRQPRRQGFESVDTLADPAPVPDLYQVGDVSYNLTDIPDDVDVQFPGHPAEQLEMTFENGSSQSITVVITAMGERA
jgi:hypothetical protein